MNDDGLVFDQTQREFFVGPCAGHAQDRRPPALDRQHTHCRRRHRSQTIEIAADARGDGGTDSRREFQDFGKRDLNRRSDGEKIVGDQLQRCDRFLFPRSRDPDPSEFVMRQPG